MGLRGPKPDPAAIKIAKGNPGRRPIGVDPAATAEHPIVVTAPSWLKGDGLEIWNRLAPDLVAKKLLGPLDVNVFGRYCRNFGRWLKMQKALDDEGEVYAIETASGKVRRAQPEFLIADRIERQLLPAEDRFGLNPAERQRIFAARASAGSSVDLFGEPIAETPAKGRRSPQPPPDGQASRQVIGILN